MATGTERSYDKRAGAFDLARIDGDFDAVFAGFLWSHVPLDRVDDLLAGIVERVVVCRRFHDGLRSNPLTAFWSLQTHPVRGVSGRDKAQPSGDRGAVAAGAGDGEKRLVGAVRIARFPTLPSRAIDAAALDAAEPPGQRGLRLSSLNGGSNWLITDPSGQPANHR